MEVDLNNFDTEKFENDEEYQDAVIDTKAGEAVAILFTLVTLQDCAEFIALTQPELVAKFFAWAEKNYPELDIDRGEATRATEEAVKAGELAIQRP